MNTIGLAKPQQRPKVLQVPHHALAHLVHGDLRCKHPVPTVLGNYRIQENIDKNLIQFHWQSMGVSFTESNVLTNLNELLAQFG